MLAQCRTGEAIAVPAGVNIAWMTGNGFFWYGKAKCSCCFVCFYVF
jgi:hypothetical protein